MASEYISKKLNVNHLCNMEIVIIEMLFLIIMCIYML